MRGTSADTLVRPLEMRYLIQMTLLRSAKAALVAVILCIASFAQMLPQPQIASAEGKPAPELTLRDQNGRTFRLSSMRGTRILIFFYRGYW